jgi:hypothetical protein
MGVHESRSSIIKTEMAVPDIRLDDSNGGIVSYRCRSARQVIGMIKAMQAGKGTELPNCTFLKGKEFKFMP